MEDLRYPIGPFNSNVTIDEISLAAWVQDIAELPAKLRAAVNGLSDEQLDTPYRPGGWTLRQVVHHLADSHINSYCRFKFALTEDNPTIKPYNEQAWAELPEAKTGPIELSLNILDTVHARWHVMLEEMTEDDYKATFRHPEAGVVSLELALAHYAWHGRHHTAHVTTTRRRHGW